MVPREDRARQVIEAFPTCFTLITLSGWLLVIATSSDDLFGTLKRTLSAFWSTQFVHGIVTLGIIYQAFYVDLQLLGSFHGLEKSSSPRAHYDPGIQHEPLLKAANAGDIGAAKKLLDVAIGKKPVGRPRKETTKPVDT